MSKEQMDFGDAIKALKEGKKVARSNWGGEFIYYKKPLEYVPREGSSEYEIHGENTIRNHPRIDVSLGNGEVCVGWLPSGADVFANNWIVVE